MKRETPIILKLGGSLIVPRLSDKGGINVPFLKAFRVLILREVKKGERFVIVTGGGRTNRVYNKAASAITEISPRDLDWIGIYTTLLNASLLRSIFANKAYEQILIKQPSLAEVRRMRASKKDIFLAAGRVPGSSTDYDTVLLAQEFGATMVIKTGDVPFVYDKDPDTFLNAKAITHISWQDYKKLIPARWEPRLSTPFDPVATRRAEKLGLTVKILDGSDIRNLQKAIEGKQFSGTIIQ